MDSDSALLEAWRAGDESAGQTLVQRHLPTVRRFMRSMAPDDTEELLQRTFTACVAARDRIEAVANFRAYLFRIARNELYALMRSRHREPVALDQHSLAELSPSPSEVIGRSEDERLLLRALRRLPVDLQVTVELWYWADLSTQELAHVLGIPEGTVGSRLNRARGRLRELIAEGSRDATWLQSTADDLDRWARSARAKSPLESPR